MKDCVNGKLDFDDPIGSGDSFAKKGIKEGVTW